MGCICCMYMPDGEMVLFLSRAVGSVRFQHTTRRMHSFKLKNCLYLEFFCAMDNYVKLISCRDVFNGLLLLLLFWGAGVVVLIHFGKLETGSHIAQVGFTFTV